MGPSGLSLASRLLFGSDFAVNLMWIDSYNSYLDLFSRTPSLSADEKLAMCSTNPGRFLFRRDEEGESSAPIISEHAPEFASDATPEVG